MTDVLSRNKRSEVMASVKGRGNQSTEMRPLKLFRVHGIKGWCRHQPLPGKPDFVFTEEQLAVFADGCFWHGCPRCYRRPKSNRKYWDAKVAGNIARDRKVSRQLRAEGWRVCRIWECRLKKSDIVIQRIRRMLGLSVLCLPLAGADKKPLTKEQSAKVIEAAIRKAAKKPTGELTKADYEKVTKLNLNRSQLTDVKGLEKLTQLKSLYLSQNKLTDVKGLEKLTELTELWLYENQLTDVKGLEKLTQLTKLILDGNQLTGVKGLEKLTKLEWLHLGNNQLTEVPMGLEKLTQLKFLYLQFNRLTDVTGLEKLTQLKVLYLYTNQLAEVPKGLEKLTQLKVLNLQHNPDLPKAQIDELQKALPKCKIYSNPKK